MLKLLKKLLVVTLVTSMLMSMLSLTTFAAEEAGTDVPLCRQEEHTHGKECYALTCGLEEGEADPGHACEYKHVHGPECGYQEGSEGTPCDCTPDEDGNHEPGCSYEPPVEGSPCTDVHEHDENCGYRAPREGHTHTLEECYDLSATICGQEEHKHTEACYNSGSEEPEETKGPEESKTPEESETPEESKAPEESETPEETDPPEETAVQVETEEELKLAFLDGKSSIVLANDITVAGTIGVGGEVTLDLNGKTLSWNNANIWNMHLFEVTGKLTITDDSGEQGASVNYSVMTAYANDDGTTTESTEDRAFALDAGTIRVLNNAEVNISEGQADEAKKENRSAAVEVRGGELVLAGGVIDGNHKARGILVSEDGAVSVEGGAVINGKVHLVWGPQYGCGIFIEKGTVDMSDGCIAQGNSVSGNMYLRGGGIALKNGALSITGGVIANNQAGVGGGIAAEKGAGTVDIGGDAVIAGNSTKLYGYGGGAAIGCDNGAYKTTIGGNALITMNIAKSDGGGIDSRNKSTLKVEGGQITGNEAHAGGGIATTNLLMVGGIVAGNTARGNTGGDSGGNGEGGGIRVGGGRANKITGGYITNNETRTTVDWGGGGIFISQDAAIKFQNLLVTGNTAQGLGGGVGGCATGQLAVSATDGLASFGNIAMGHKENGAHAPHKWQDQAALKNDDFLRYGSNDFFCAHSSYVTDALLGGGSANWHGSKDTGEGYRGSSAEDGEIDVQFLAIPKGGTDAAAYLMGLSASPTIEDQAAAITAARVFISGNESSTHGGGIMCNGVMFIGAIENREEKFSSVPVEAEKRYQNADGTPITLKDGQFTFALVPENGFKIVDGRPSYTAAQTAANDENGKVLFTINDLKEEGKYAYYLVEEPGTGPIAYDPAIYKVEVEVTAGQTITWQIDTKIITTVYNGQVSCVAEMEIDENGGLVEKEPAGPQPETVEPPCFTNTYVGTLTVTKNWVGDSETTRPAGIRVQLYKDGVAVDDPVELSAEKGWTYTWEELEYGAEYTANEVDVPEGYTSETSQSGNTVTITNTYEVPVTPSSRPSSRPDDPDDPEPSSSPSPAPAEPPAPQEPPAPEEELPEEELPDEEPPLAGPEILEEAGTPLADVPRKEEELLEDDVPLAEVPQTGDSLALWLTSALLSAAGLVWISLQDNKGKRIARK